jgi:pyruvate/2-oxoglutarate dehydrogenase complex dihydrolipoamide acyltransferase (E2) component
MRTVREATDTTTATSGRSKPSKGQLIAGTIIAVFAIGGITSILGGGSDTAAPAAPAPISVAADQPKAHADAPAEAKSEAPAPAPVAPAEAPAPVAPAPAEAPAVHYMPDVVGMNLQDAQDKIQEAGVWFSRSEDATGQGRMQVLDRDWTVLSQNIEPGTPFTEGEAVLSVKKIWE